MKITEEVVTYFTLISVICACAGAFQSVPFTNNPGPDDIETILDELRTALHASNKPDTLQNTDRFSLSEIDSQDLNSENQLNNNVLGSLETMQNLRHPLLSALLTRTDNSKGIDVNKRQGAWDYDYGLGGGRFGKRAGMFADYALGGGRFGRDVNHVNQIGGSDVDFEDHLED